MFVVSIVSIAGLGDQASCQRDHRSRGRHGDGIQHELHANLQVRRQASLPGKVGAVQGAEQQFV